MALPAESRQAFPAVAKPVAPNHQENQIMTGEAASVPAQPYPPQFPVRADARRVPDDLVVTDLVTRARNGDKRAWDALVDRYAPLIWSICRRYRLAGTDADDVGQSVWLHLVDQLGRIRDPAALPGWLATTTRRECVRMLRATRGPSADWHLLDADRIPDEQAGTAEEELLMAERSLALREAFTELPPSCRQLIALLIEDPPVQYAEISARLGMAIGSIGPNRSRCLDKLRRHPAIAALINVGASADENAWPGSAR